MSSPRYNALYEEPTSAAPPRVTVSFGESTLDVRDLDGLLVAQWAYGDLEAAGPVRPGQALVLRCKASPRARLTLLDAAILAPLRAKAPQVVRQAVRRDGLLAGCSPGLLIGCGLGCLLIVIAPLLVAGGFLAWLGLPGWWSDDLRGEAMADRLLGWAAPAFEVSLPPACTKAAGQEWIDRLVRRIAPAGGLDTPPEVTVLDALEPLAFHLGRERLFLTWGLIERLDDGDQLSAILAHELGHMAQGDSLSLTSQRDDRGWRLSATACSSESDALEADAWALRALSRADLTASGLTRHVDRLPRGLSGAWDTYLCFHPVTDERLRALRMMTPEGGAPALADDAWQDVRGICGDRDAAS